MRMLTNTAVPGPTARNGLQSWKPAKRNVPGSRTLKIKYSRVFGYALEVTNSFKDQVPDNYVRKQTLTNAERYITQELKELEDLILGAEDRLYALEYELFADVRDKVGQEVVRIQTNSEGSCSARCFCFSCTCC